VTLLAAGIARDHHRERVIEVDQSPSHDAHEIVGLENELIQSFSRGFECDHLKCLFEELVGKIRQCRNPGHGQKPTG
jgi:hypothetical protein